MNERKTGPYSPDELAAIRAMAEKCDPGSLTRRLLTTLDYQRECTEDAAKTLLIELRRERARAEAAERKLALVASALGMAPESDLAATVRILRAGAVAAAEKEADCG